MIPEDLLDLLSALEFVSTTEGVVGPRARLFCPWCDGLQQGTQELSDPEPHHEPGSLEGHRPGCRLRAAIDMLSTDHDPECDLDEDCTCSASEQADVVAPKEDECTCSGPCEGCRF